MAIDNYNRLFRQLKFDIIKSVLIGTLLDTIIFFIIIHIIVSLLDLKILYVFIISATTSLLFSFGMFKRKYERQNLKRFEENNPDLKEILRTANDYKNEDTLMTHAMFFDLFNKVKKVSTGTLIKPREIYIKYIIICALALVMVSLSTIGTVNVMNYSQSIAKLNVNRFFSFDSELEDITNTTFIEDDRIYGDADVAALGNEQLQLDLSMGFANSDFESIKDAQDDLAFKNSGFPIEAELEASENNAESQIEETELARAYLESIGK